MGVTFVVSFVRPWRPGLDSPIISGTLRLVQGEMGEDGNFKMKPMRAPERSTLTSSRAEDAEG